MPLYEYRCHQCGKTFEIIQKFADTPLTVHQDCGGELERLISAPGLHFKGTGWYVTDYSRSGSGAKPPAGESSKSEGKSESSSESKSETKSEAKSESKSDSKTESKSETKSSDKKSDSKSSDKKSDSKPAN